MQAVADIIRTTLGPRSMLKMLLDANGGIVLTNDGHAILREIDVSHPAAKVSQRRHSLEQRWKYRESLHGACRSCR